MTWLTSHWRRWRACWCSWPQVACVWRLLFWNFLFSGDLSCVLGEAPSPRLRPGLTHLHTHRTVLDSPILNYSVTPYQFDKNTYCKIRCTTRFLTTMELHNVTKQLGSQIAQLLCTWPCPASSPGSVGNHTFRPLVPEPCLRPSLLASLWLCVKQSGQDVATIFFHCPDWLYQFVDAGLLLF